MSTHVLKNGHVFVRVRGQQKTMADLTTILNVPGDGPVVDKTGLTGKYDFTLEYEQPRNVASDGAPDTPIAPSVFSALQQQLGLQLVSKRIPLEVLVIDSFDRAPSEN